MKQEEFIELVLSFQGTEQNPHFDRLGFRVTGKRMFCSYLPADNSTNIFLTPEEQKIFCELDAHIYPVPNKWGEKGATTFELDHLSREVVLEALTSAYNQVLQPKK